MEIMRQLRYNAEGFDNSDRIFNLLVVLSVRFRLLLADPNKNNIIKLIVQWIVFSLKWIVILISID